MARVGEKERSMKSELDLINDYLDRILFIARGLPVSPHGACLDADIREARRKWVAMYLEGEKRAKKARVS